MTSRRSLAFLVVLVLILAGGLSPRLQATNGYFAHGYGTAQKGMAGAGVALTFGPMDTATNPAGVTFGPSGVDLGVALFSPDRQYEVTGAPSGYPGTFGLQPGAVRSGSRLFPIPSFAASWKVGRAGAFGLAMYGNGGMNTDYDHPTFGFSPTGVNLSQMFFAPSYSVKIARNHAVGAAALIAYQRFDAKGLRAFSIFSSSPSNLTDKGAANAFGAGVRVGYLGQLTPQVSVGASFQSRITMGKLDKYAGLFAEQGGFDIPSNWVVGIAVKPVPSVDVALDVQHVAYSGVKSIGNHLLPNIMSSPLGSDNGAGFGWDDVTTVKAGVQWRAGHGWTWRGGYSKGNQPIPSSEVLFNILAPGVVEQHVTFGLSRDLGRGKAFHASIMRALEGEVSGPNPLEVPGRQQIKLSMTQWEFEFGYSLKF